MEKLGQNIEIMIDSQYKGKRISNDIIYNRFPKYKRTIENQDGVKQ